MQNLWQFLSRHFHWLLFLLLEVASVVMLLRYNNYQGSVWVSSANAVAGKVYEWQANVEQFFSLTRNNEELSLRNFYLERQLSQLRRLYAEQTGDTTAAERAELQALSQYKLIPAKVVNNTLDRPDNLITIDKGRADGVMPDMGVACGGGLVGVVYQVSDHYAVIISLLNSSSRVSCAIRDRGYFGYLSWSGGDPSVAFVDDIPRHAKFKRGEWVETSGYSSIFPPGVSVGKIVQVYNSRDGLSYRLKVHLSTDFGCLRDVFVISDNSIAERVRLQQAVTDSLKKLR
ncbi:MAG: rod shape-determining protein MreC [Prevotella sp.]|nr:rod shape-determining protein MreC [Prevotella sp.]